MEKQEYKPSGELEQAKNALQEQKKKQPEAYKSAWEAQLAAVMDRILNREDFHYSLDGDALYRQLRDQAKRDGHLAMTDAMGTAAALTGGYGNSYAQILGQQLYGQQMENLADRIPELYALALEQYRQQTDGLRQKYDLLAGAENQDYNRYRDALDAWQKEANLLQQQYIDSRNFDYGAYRDGVADWRWQQEFDENLRRYERDWADKHPTVVPQPSYTPPAKKEEKEKSKEKMPGFSGSAGSGSQKPVLL